MLSKNLLKDITGVLGSNLFILTNNLLISILIARTLGPVGKGLFESIFIIPLLAISLAEMGISRSIIYYIGKKTFKNEIILSALLILLLATSIIAIVLSILLFVIFKDTSITLQYIFILLIGIPFRLFVIYCRGFFLGNEKLKEANLLQWLPVFIYLIILSVFLVTHSFTIQNGLISFTLSSIIVAIIAWKKAYYKQIIKLKEGRVIIFKLLKLGLLFSVAIFILFLNYRIDILILKQLSTFKQIGIYTLGVSLAEQLWQLPAAIGIVMISRSVNSTDYNKLNKEVAIVLRLSFLVLFFGSIFLFFAAPLLIDFFYGQAFSETILVVRVLLPGILLFSIISIIGNTFAGIGKAIVIIKIFLPVLILNILFNIIFIPIYGAIGAAMATNISYTTGAIILLITYKKTMKTTYKELLFYKKADFFFIENILLKIFNKNKNGLN